MGFPRNDHGPRDLLDGANEAATPAAAADDSTGMNTDVHTAGTRLDEETVRVAAWRRTRLLATGFAPALADELASEHGIDLHALIDLVERGCPPELAARILAPLDSGRNALSGQTPAQ